MTGQEPGVVAGPCELCGDKDPDERRMIGFWNKEMREWQFWLCRACHASLREQAAAEGTTIMRILKAMGEVRDP